MYPITFLAGFKKCKTCVLYNVVELKLPTSIQCHNTKIVSVWDPIMHFKSWWY